MKRSLILTLGLWANAIIAVYAWIATNDLVIFWQIMTRLSGRVSLGVFILLFIYETILLKKRNVPTFFESTTMWHWRAGFAIHHYLHLIFIGIYVVSSGIELVPFRLAGGALAYLLIGVMPFLSVQILEKKWLRFFYLYYVWFVMFMTYVARLQRDFPNAGGNYTEYVFFSSILVLALGWNLFLIIFSKNKSMSAA